MSKDPVILYFVFKIKFYFLASLFTISLFAIVPKSSWNTTDISYERSYVSPSQLLLIALGLNE